MDREGERGREYDDEEGNEGEGEIDRAEGDDEEDKGGGWNGDGAIADDKRLLALATAGTDIVAIMLSLSARDFRRSELLVSDVDL